MNIYLDGQGWGGAVRENICAVLESEDRSHRPHRHPNQHTPEEIKLILNCATGILTPVSLYFGSNFVQEDTPILSPACIAFSENEIQWL